MLHCLQFFGPSQGPKLVFVRILLLSRRLCPYKFHSFQLAVCIQQAHASARQHICACLHFSFQSVWLCIGEICVSSFRTPAPPRSDGIPVQQRVRLQAGLSSISAAWLSSEKNSPSSRQLHNWLRTQKSCNPSYMNQQLGNGVSAENRVMQRSFVDHPLGLSWEMANPFFWRSCSGLSLSLAIPCGQRWSRAGQWAGRRQPGRSRRRRHACTGT